MTVGFVYDDIYLEHDTGQHPENSDRLRNIMSVLEESEVKAQLIAIPSREITIEELARVHSKAHISNIKARSESGGGWLDVDTIVSPDSYQAALCAAGGVMQAVEAVMEGEVTTAFALVRPPGHHATWDWAMGFCLFNNIAVAARNALEKYSLERILIADFDVHHGNGTQDTFYSNPHVLYFSTHQFPFYPGSGRAEEIGRDEGKGFTLNVPLPAGCGDIEYLRAYNEILVPRALAFNPQLILVSAGYDAHWKDTIASMQLTTSGYAQLTYILKALADETCDGKLVLVLEGGYHPEALPYSVRASFEVLLGETQTYDSLGAPDTPHQTPNIDGILSQVKKMHNIEQVSSMHLGS